MPFNHTAAMKSDFNVIGVKLQLSSMIYAVTSFPVQSAAFSFGTLYCVKRTFLK